MCTYLNIDAILLTTSWSAWIDLCVYLQVIWTTGGGYGSTLLIFQLEENDGWIGSY